MRLPALLAVSTLAIAATMPSLPALAQGCTHTVGVVVELTGPAGRFGQAASKSVELAFNDLNAAGGVAGCRLATELRDSQSQGAVAVDQARQLVDLRRVPAIIGGIISSVSIPVLTSVTAPAGIVQISPKATIVQSEDRTDPAAYSGLGLRGYLTNRFLLQAEYRKFVVLTSRDDNEEIDEWTVGFTYFF